jgi:hypothetical protein
MGSTNATALQGWKPMSDTYTTGSPRSVRNLKPSATTPPGLSRPSGTTYAKSWTADDDGEARRQRLRALAQILTIGIDALRAEAR